VTRPAAPLTAFELTKAILASPPLAKALATAAIGTAVFTFPIHQLIGWPGLIGILASLVVLAMVALAAQWREIGWNGLLPISLIAFVGWAGVSFLWSQYHWATLGGFSYLLAFSILGIFVALARDTIQIVRTFGDVLRFALALSLALEIFSGILINRPIHILGITGRIALLGPIQGLFTTRDQLGLVCVVALITFGTELRTKSIGRGWGIASVIVGSIMLLLTRAPLAFGAMLVVGSAAGALYLLRRASAGSRQVWQFVVLAAAGAIAIVAWIYRSPIVSAFNASGDLTYRLTVWRAVFALTQAKVLQGWGWVGAWPTTSAPFDLISGSNSRLAQSASNAYLDVWFQTGLIGFIIFLGFLGLAFTRSWLLASRRRSVVFAWPALVLVTLFIGSLAESSILIEFGWMTLVVCSVKASRELSWRTAFEAVAIPQSPPEPHSN
jgi:O-antigen ligase